MRAVIVGLLLLAGLIPSPAVARAATPKPLPISIAVAGDSTTAQTNSWLCHIHAPDFNAAYGFARSGYRTDQVLAAIKSSPNANILVVMLGINDIHYPAYNHFDGIVARINQIVAKVGAQKVIIAATAPSNITDYNQNGSKHVNSRSEQDALNSVLRNDAKMNGWYYFDPYYNMRAVGGAYKSLAYTADGVHPSTAGYIQEAKNFAAEFTSIEGR